MKFEKITEKIIGSAYCIYNKMGYGFLESVYENALLIELRKADLECFPQKRLKVVYDDTIIGEFVADIIVENAIIIELKSVMSIVPVHEQQLVNYLTATGIEVGLLINFGPKMVEIKRKIRELPNS